jgi:hypothetical protein
VSKITWRSELVYVVKCWDELWIGVKFQSNRDIAGSLRNSFTASVRVKIMEGRALNMQGPHLEVLSINKLRIPIIISSSQY